LVFSKVKFREQGICSLQRVVYRPDVRAKKIPESVEYRSGDALFYPRIHVAQPFLFMKAGHAQSFHVAGGSNWVFSFFRQVF
jgi:hypothetical protein